MNNVLYDVSFKVLIWDWVLQQLRTATEMQTKMSFLHALDTIHCNFLHLEIFACILSVLLSQEHQWYRITWQPLHSSNLKATFAQNTQWRKAASRNWKTNTFLCKCIPSSLTEWKRTRIPCLNFLDKSEVFVAFILGCQKWSLTLLRVCWVQFQSSHSLSN